MVRVSPVLFSCLVLKVDGHGHITFPPNRAKGNLSVAGLSDWNPDAPFLWFSQPMVIPGEPTLNDAEFRTYNVHVKSGDHDWSRRMPWRAPGAAPVRGSGCGVAGGADVMIPNGGSAPPGYAMGVDGLELPENKPSVWKIGGVETVGFALLANHGGGYSWRLCKKGGNVTEECFQQNTLPFHGESSWLHYAEVIPSRDDSGPLKFPKVEIPRVVVPGEQVHPKGSHWARNPIPGCNYCDQTKCGGLLPNTTEKITIPPFDQLPENYTQYGGNAWYKSEMCAQQCSGFNFMQCPPGMQQFDEPAPGISGYIGNFMVMGTDIEAAGKVVGIEGFSYSIMDEVKVPEHLDEGEYLLSWRWDCEQSPQIWQQCADIKLVKDTSVQVLV